MRCHVGWFVLVGLMVESAAMVQAGTRDEPKSWKPHAEDRPTPKQVDPGVYPGPQPAPSDATVLFSGKEEDLSNWQKAGEADAPAEWAIDDQGRLKVVPGTGSIRTKQSFGDCQLHIEWMANPNVSGEPQHRSNSGVFLAGQYEVQVLDTYENTTYADGMAGAIYGQYPPLINATRPPGEWQTFDIIYNQPHFNDQGEVTEPARLTVFHNGVLVQRNEPLTGPTSYQKRPPYEAHDKGPILLQDHKDNPLWFKNIWVRELE